MTFNDNSLLFRRQFIVGPAALAPCELTEIHRFSNLYISAHPDTEINSSSADDVELVCIGYLLDPNNVSLSTNDIVTLWLDKIDSFALFENLASLVGGRWLMFVRIGAELRLYPDAAGMKSLFYTSDSGFSGLWAGSQPRLLSEKLNLPIDYGMAKEFLSGKFQNSWPGEITPYLGVKQLLPNHYLNLHSGLAYRFWPRESVKSWELGEAVEEISSVLCKLVQSAQMDRGLALPISGGYDSRVLLACSNDCRNDMDIFTVSSPDTEYYDIWIPRKLAATVGINYRVLKVTPTDDEFWEVFKRNTSYMFSDPSNIMVNTFATLPEDVFVLTGHVAEITRCFYYEDGDHPDVLDGEDLARLAGFEGNEVAISSFSAWLEDVPRTSGVKILDLLYWEHRLGNWAAMMATGFDMTCDIIPLFNCRHLLEIGLGVDVQYRAKPYDFFRQICSHAEPRIATVPFNASLWDSASNLIQRHISWRMWRMAYAARMRQAGLGNWVTRLRGSSAMRELLTATSGVTNE